MPRFILFVILGFILYYALRFLMRDVASPKKRMSRESEPEELVRDPYCQTYISKRSAVKKKIAGREYYFCNMECLKRFLQKDT